MNASGGLQAFSPHATSDFDATATLIVAVLFILAYAVWEWRRNRGRPGQVTPA